MVVLDAAELFSNLYMAWSDSCMNLYMENSLDHRLRESNGAYWKMLNSIY